MSQWFKYSKKWASTTVVLIPSFAAALYSNNSSCKDLSNDNDNDKVKVYTRKEVEKHVTADKGIWVIYNNDVYDITKFIANHPGGKDKIMLAAGKDVEPFWRVYRQHYNSKLPLEQLNPLKIGSLNPADVMKTDPKTKDDDPYKHDPSVSPVMIVHSSKPVNAEPPATTMVDTFITPNELFFVRNHHPVPIIDEKMYKIPIYVEGKEGSVLTLTLDDLKNKYESVEVTSTIQCGGNRRKQMNEVTVTAGSPWIIGAISTATWKGVKLADILESVGVTPKVADANGLNHVQFLAADSGMEASIPITKALNYRGDVILAYEMNGQPIPPEHGFPVRAVVPGHVGVRNVKWVSKITVAKEESMGTWQRGMAYKGLPPSAKTLDGIDVEKIPSLQEMAVQSAITFPQSQGTLEPGVNNTIKGYAYSGGGKGIVRVDVSIDKGKTWKTATLTEGRDQPIDRAWAWTLWEADFLIPESLVNTDVTIICKATDASYNVQPDSVEGIWNLRGINNNSWHRVLAKVVPDEPSEE